MPAKLRAARAERSRAPGGRHLGGAALLMAAGIAAPASSSLAAEGAVFGGPTGGTDIRSAYSPPVPGFYGNLVGLYVLGNGTDGDTGQKLPVHVNTNLGVAAGGILYAYPFRAFGGSLDSFVQQAFAYGYAEIGPRKGYASGANDTFVEVLGWSRYLGNVFGETASSRPHPKLPYGLTIKAAYSMIIPDGDYNRNYVLPQGHNDWFFIPNAAVTYLTQPNAIGDGIEFDAHLFADLATRNRITDYTTGPVIDVDYAVADRYKQWEFGLAGFYAQEVGRDEQGGKVVAPNGKRLLLVDMGPVIAYDFPKWHSTFKVKYQIPVVTQNSLTVQRVVLSYSFRF